MNSPIYSLDVAAWFKSTFSQDSNGKIIPITYPAYESSRYYSLWHTGYY